MSDDPRARLRALFETGVAAADPFDATAAALPAAPPARIIAVGKAARRMAEAALARFPGTPTLVVTVDGADAPLAGAEVLASSHPVPDQRGAAAAEAVIAAVEPLGAEDRLLVLVSGGASALLPAPVAGVTLEDKIAVTRALLGSGAEINEVNHVRQQLSRLKGGGLLRHAAPAQVTALVLSDVIGDDLSAIGSGITVAPIGTPESARALLERLSIWGEMPASVRHHLETAPAPAPLPAAENIIVGSNGQSCAAMAARAGAAQIVEPAVTGDVAEAAARLVDAAGPGLTLWGGETTVKLAGSGLGGRNQELALRIALLAEARGWPAGWVCLCGGTDGRDGPTDAAGGLVDAGTPGRIRAAGIDPEAALANNDSYHALRAAGDLLMTGATGTNVADLGLVWRP